MNRRQKSIILNFVLVITFTTAFVIVMLNVKDYVNKSEAIRGMNLLAQQIIQYREKSNSLPPNSYVQRQKDQLRLVRLGDLEYRAQWIGYNAEPDTILAYTYKNYRLMIKRGYVVIRLNGQVEWMLKKEFQELLGKHQTKAEIEILEKAPKF